MRFVASKGKKSTRDIILQTIRKSQQANVEELAEVANVSPVTVRHHLNALQADGLIETTSVRRKVGRPYYVYSLSERGQELFPKRYVRLTSRLLDELKSRLPAEMVTDLFGSVVEGVIDDHRSEFESLDFEGRLDYLIELLAEEGFVASWEKTDSGYQLTEHSCPYLSIGRTHSEICTFDRQLIVSVLETPIEQHTCMLEGAECCQFTIHTNGTVKLGDINLS